MLSATNYAQNYAGIIGKALDLGLKGHQITDLLTHIHVSQQCFCLQVWF